MAGHPESRGRPAERGGRLVPAGGRGARVSPCTAASPSWRPAPFATRTRSTRSCKILVDFAISTVAYFFIGYTIAYGVAFFVSAQSAQRRQRRLRRAGPDSGQVLLPVHLRRRGSGHRLGRHRRARALQLRNAWPPRCIVGLFYPFFEGIVWNKNLRPAGAFFKARLGDEFHDFAGSIVVHAVGGWIALLRRAPARAAARALSTEAARVGIPPSSIPWLAHGLLAAVHRLVRLQRDERAVAAGRHAAWSPSNSLMAMCGGIIAALDRRRRRSRLHPQRRAGRPRRGVRRLRRDAPDRLAVRRRRRRRDLRLRVPAITFFWA